jgi:hypothetical protein
MGMNAVKSHPLKFLSSSEASLCAGDWVQVKLKEEILATLDENGALDGMPFMPEMLKYCGRRLRVSKRAHKTCDFSSTMEARRVPSAVHLEGLRCTGEAHDGCQAECLLFWKEAWLTPVEADGSVAAAAGPATANSQDGSHAAARPACTDAMLHAATRETDGPDSTYSCQMTCIPKFSTHLRAGELDQYVEAYRSGNVRLREMFAPLLFRVYERFVWSRFGPELPQALYDAFQKLRGGLPYPNRLGLIPDGQKTPLGEKLNLQPGDVVRVKSFASIRATLNRDAKNRGLLFSQEMVPYCGQVFRVHSRVSQIISETTRKMLHFGSDSIVLENVVCQGRYNAGLSFCPRANYSFWREIWLERAGPNDLPADQRCEIPCPSAALPSAVGES